MSDLKKRVQWIDVVKYICIIFVMLSHLEANTNALSRFYSPFYLSGFFFASGYVYHNKNGFKQFLIKKVKGLFIPWLFFSVFNILLSQLITFNEHTSLIEELKWNFLQIRGKGDGIWFVAALFVAFMPFYFFIKKYDESKKRKKDKAIFIVIALVLALISSLYAEYMDPGLLPWGTASLPWHIEYVFIAMFWMTLGYFFRDEYEQTCDARVKTISVVAVFAVYAAIRYIPMIFKFEFGSISGIFYSYISSLIGVFLLVYTGKRIPANKYMLYIGQNTLLCFALHGKIYSIIQTILKKVAGAIYSGILANVFTSSVFALAFSIALSLILIIPIYIINRWFPFLIGRKLRRNDNTVGSDKH